MWIKLPPAPGSFCQGSFLLRKWSSSELEVLQHIDAKLCEQKSTCLISDPDDYAKTLGIEWNSTLDHFASLCVRPSTM